MRRYRSAPYSIQLQDADIASLARTTITPPAEVLANVLAEMHLEKLVVLWLEVLQRRPPNWLVPSNSAAWQLLMLKCNHEQGAWPVPFERYALDGYTLLHGQPLHRLSKAASARVRVY